MEREGQRQCQSGDAPTPMIGRGDLITPNPKLKLLDQVREVMAAQALLDSHRDGELRMDSAVHPLPSDEGARRVGAGYGKGGGVSERSGRQGPRGRFDAEHRTSNTEG